MGNEPTGRYSEFGMLGVPFKESIEDLGKQFLKTMTFDDRFGIVWNFMMTASIYDPNHLKVNKTVADSISWRQIGNKEFTTAKNEDYISKSIEAYTKSIAHAPIGSSELSLAYGNRSAVLFKARLYEDCLLDIERSLKAGYPDKLKTKLFLRQSLCFKALKPSSHIETGISMASAMQWLPNLKKNNPNYNIKDEYSKMMNQLEKPRDTNTAKFKPTIKNKSSIIAGGSDAIKLIKSNRNNQHIVAARSIKSGEFIYINKPFEMITCDDKRYNTCWHCCRQTLAGIPCDKCPNIVFCSQECKNIAWNEYHELECPISSFSKKLELCVEDEWQFQLTIKILSKALKATGGIDALDKKINEVDSKKDKSMIHTDGMFDVNTIDNFHRLDYYKPTSDKCSLARVIRISAIVLMFGLETNIFGRKMKLLEIYSNKQSPVLGVLILRYLMIVERNVTYCNDDVTEPVRLTQAIIFPFENMLVKNCDPHVNWYGYDWNISIVAERPIKKGEKIRISSSDRYQDMPLSERRKYVASFDLPPCKCTACVQDLPLMDNLTSYKSLKLSNQVRRELDRIMIKSAGYSELIAEGDAEKLLKIKDTLAKMTDKFYQHVTVPCREASFFTLMIGMVHFHLCTPRYDVAKKIKTEFDSMMQELKECQELFEEGNNTKLLTIKDTLSSINDKFHHYITVPCKEISHLSLLLKKLYVRLHTVHNTLE
ncbi:SET and MYND domain-containing protein 4-like [Aphidius gifuensis]|uniref:SET and MYND domain-containing protein 4-like n=1 Tax=Aphidius gifuensis TaxID=684658 RepID=UPI001CDCE30C|nr:SET and MYND domain-containing protein 4-like [Aphidius gifuensis]